MRTWSFVAGLAAGVGLGVLFARQSGKETQRFLQRKGRESFDELASATTKAGDQVRNAISTGTAQVLEGVGAAQEAYRKSVGG
jgi:gas vesicle protein